MALGSYFQSGEKNCVSTSSACTFALNRKIKRAPLSYQTVTLSMGTCSFKAFYGRSGDTVQIMMDSGGIMHFKGPVSVDSIVKDFPGNGIFARNDATAPLRSHDQLINGCSYYLLPLVIESKEDVRIVPSEPTEPVGTVPAGSGRGPTDQGASEPSMEVLTPKWEGMWRVKLVVSSEQSNEIFSKQADTEAFIERMSTAAKAKQAEDGQLSRCSSRRSVRSLVTGSSA